MQKITESKILSDSFLLIINLNLKVNPSLTLLFFADFLWKAQIYDQQ